MGIIETKLRALVQELLEHPGLDDRKFFQEKLEAVDRVDEGIELLGRLETNPPLEHTPASLTELARQPIVGRARHGLAAVQSRVEFRPAKLVIRGDGKRDGGVEVHLEIDVVKLDPAMYGVFTSMFGRSTTEEVEVDIMAAFGDEDVSDVDPFTVRSEYVNPAVMVAFAPMGPS